MTTMTRTASLFLLAILIAGCAGSPFETRDRPISDTGPAHVLDDSGRIGDVVIWGGQIVAVRNLPDATELEVVSRPLDRFDRPRLHDEPGVRFLALRPGFLEPTTYAPGRFITLLGRVQDVEERQVEEFQYRQPVVEVEEIHLWPADPERWRGSTHFSVGVGIRL